MGALNTVHPGWGIFVVRVMAGIILIVAGYTKFAGGIGGFAGFVGQLGFPAPELTAPLIAAWELITGLLLLVGLGTRWVALLMVIEFLTTTFIVKLPRAGWDNSRIDMMMLAAGVLFLLAGPGKAAVDEMMARKRGVGYGEPARV